MTMPCVFATLPLISRHEGKEFPTVRCLAVSAVNGRLARIGEMFCNNNCDARTEKVGAAMPDPHDHPIFREKCAYHLAARCRAGELPHHTETPFDVRAGFRLYKQLAGAAAARTLLKEMVYYQSSIPEAGGGLPAETLDATFEDIAEEHDMQDVLQQIERRHHAAR